MCELAFLSLAATQVLALLLTLKLQSVSDCVLRKGISFYYHGWNQNSQFLQHLKEMTRPSEVSNEIRMSLSQLKEEFHLQRGNRILNITSPTSTQDLSAGIGNYTVAVTFAHVDNISKCVALLFLCQLDITAIPMRGNTLRDFSSTRLDANGFLKFFSHLL